MRSREPQPIGWSDVRNFLVGAGTIIGALGLGLALVGLFALATNWLGSETMLAIFLAVALTSLVAWGGFDYARSQRPFTRT